MMMIVSIVLVLVLVVSIQTVMDTTKYANGNRTFALAQELSETFAVRHTLLANPLKFGTNRTFVVQPIKIYSQHSILFKCNRESLIGSKQNNTDPFEWAKTLQFHDALVDPIKYEE